MAAPCVIDEGTKFTTFIESGQWSADAAVTASQLTYTRDSTPKSSCALTLVRAATVTTGWYTRNSGLSHVFSAAERAVMAIDVWARANDEAGPTCDSGAYITVEFSSVSDFSKKFTFDKHYIHSGWNRILIAEDDWSSVGGESWANTMIRMRVGVTSTYYGFTPRLVFDYLFTGVQTTPCVLITFDDCYESVYDSVLPYMSGLGMVGTLYLQSNKLGDAGSMTAAEVRALQAAGWSVGNHSQSHAMLDRRQASAVWTELVDCVSDAAAAGISLSPHHSYPYGYYSETTRWVLARLGFLTARMAIGPGYQGAPLDNPLTLSCRSVTTDNSLATAEGWVDTAIAKGATLILLFHDIGGAGAGGTEWSIADFQALMDYIVASEVAVKNIDDWYSFASDPDSTVLDGPMLLRVTRPTLEEQPH